MRKGQEGKVDMQLAAACGLCCEACSLYIATKEDPERLKVLAARLQLSEEAATCHGCRSDKKSAYCDTCRMSACTAGRGIAFCNECAEYPCDHLKTFQAERPHRIELWDDLDRIMAVGPEQWLQEVRGHYSCPTCRTVNSAYDLKCRKCGEAPSCGYVGRHGQAIERFLSNR